MSKSYYSSDNLTIQKAELSTYIKNITEALDEINKVTPLNDLKCEVGKEFSDSFDVIKSKIPSIKKSLASFEEFLVLTNKTYNNLSQDVSDALDAYLAK